MPQRSDLKQISGFLARLTNDPKSRKYSTVITTGKQQLVVMKDSSPVLRLGIGEVDAEEAYRIGLNLIENLVVKFDDFKHFVLLYDDASAARNVEFKYLQNGLTRGERCIYVISHDDIETTESIRLQMESFGIRTSRFLRNNQLVITSIPEAGKDVESFRENCQSVLDALLGDSRTMHVRMVVHARYELDSDAEIEGHAELENMVEALSEQFPGSILCNHNIGKYTPNKHGKWIDAVLRAHGVCLVVSSKKSTPNLFRENSDMFTSYSLSSFVDPTDGRRGQEEILRRDSDADGNERDIVELRNDIDFLVAQLRADLYNYSPSELYKAILKIVRLSEEEEAITGLSNDT
jgi:hypothetical protein